MAARILKALETLTKADGINSIEDAVDHATAFINTEDEKQRPAEIFFQLGDALMKASKPEIAAHCFKRTYLFLEEEQKEESWEAALALRMAGESLVKAKGPSPESKKYFEDVIALKKALNCCGKEHAPGMFGGGVKVGESWRFWARAHGSLAMCLEGLGDVRGAQDQKNITKQIFLAFSQ